MSEIKLQHPFLRARTSYFEAWTAHDEKSEKTRTFVRELMWREFRQIQLHPEAIQFYGRDQFYDVVVITKSSLTKNQLRDIATDIYQGKYERREISLKWRD